MSYAWRRCFRAHRSAATLKLSQLHRLLKGLLTVSMLIGARLRLMRVWGRYERELFYFESADTESERTGSGVAAAPATFGSTPPPPTFPAPPLHPPPRLRYSASFDSTKSHPG